MANEEEIFCPVCDEYKQEWRHRKDRNIRMRVHFDTHRAKQHHMLQKLRKSLAKSAQNLQDDLLGPLPKLHETYEILQRVEYDIKRWEACPQVPKFTMYLHRTKMPDCRYITYEHLPFPQILEPIKLKSA